MKFSPSSGSLTANGQGRDDTLKNPFEALMAHRTVCATCGYGKYAMRPSGNRD